MTIDRHIVGDSRVCVHVLLSRFETTKETKEYFLYVFLRVSTTTVSGGPQMNVIWSPVHDFFGGCALVISSIIIISSNLKRWISPNVKKAQKKKYDNIYYDDHRG